MLVGAVREQPMFNDALDAAKAHSGLPRISVKVSFIYVRVVCFEIALGAVGGEGQAIKCGFPGPLCVVAIIVCQLDVFFSKRVPGICETFFAY